MSISPGSNMPENVPVQVSSTPRWIYAVFIILAAGIGYVAYAANSARTQLTSDLAKAQDQNTQLSARLDQANERIAELRGQLQVTSSKLGLTQTEVARAHSLAQQDLEQQQASDQKLTAQIGQVQQSQQQSDAKIAQVSTDVNGAKTAIDATNKDLADTKSKLSMAVGDLTNQGTLIAKNNDELQELKRLGERNIYDFSLGKTKGPQKVGPIQLLLKSVDTKHYRYTVVVVADDKQIEKKDKTVDDLLQFYVHGARSPYELVVFEVGKDKITGYLSTPKDTATAAAAPAAKPEL
jgi:predicted  nucleic acid-binding Zn-ribbon protein